MVGVIIDKPPHNMTAILLSKQTIDYPRHLRCLDFKFSFIFLRLRDLTVNLDQNDQHPTLLGSGGKVCSDISDTITRLRCVG